MHFPFSVVPVFPEELVSEGVAEPESAGLAIREPAAILGAVTGFLCHLGRWYVEGDFCWD